MELDHKPYGITADDRDDVTNPTGVFTNEMITIYAEAAKKYWGMWGPLGQPAICSVEIWWRSQQRYLEALEAILASPDILQTPQKARTPLRDCLRDLFTGFGVEFDS